MSRPYILSAVIVASFMTASPIPAQEGQSLAKIRMGEDGQIQVLDSMISESRIPSSSQNETPAQIMNPGPNLTTGHPINAGNYPPNLIITVRILNNGNYTAGPSRIGYYISADENITTSDILLGDDYVPSIPFSSYTDQSITLSEAGHPGHWYVGFIIDYQNDVVEDNESDNTYIIAPFYFPPAGSDLTFIGTISTSSNYVYPNLTINVAVKNEGVTTAGASRLGYYLSTDSHIDRTDHLIGYDNVPELGLWSISYETITVDVSGFSGTWWPGFIIDDQDDVYEEIETNNTGVFAPLEIPSQPPVPTQCDLIVTSVQINDHEGPDTSYNLTVENQGTEATVSHFKNIIYLSEDKTITSADYRINDWNVTESLAPGESKTSWDLSSNVSSVPAGEYYLGVIADGNNDIAESDEYNNTFCVDSPKIIIENQSSEPIIVTNSNDSGAGSLRNAIDQVNANPGSDIILFNIPQADPGYDASSGVWTIRPLTALPVISDSLTIINGFSQQDFSGDTNPDGLEIELDGSQIVTGIAHGLFIMSARNTVQGLAIYRFPNSGIMLTGPSANDNLLTNNFIGLSATIDALLPNGSYGIYIVEGARNQIGCLEETGLGKAGKTRQKLFNMAPEHLSEQYEFTGQNIIAGNLDCGIYISGEVANNNQIVNNQVIYNESHGIYLSDRVQGTTIYWNAIAYNAGAGVVVHGTNAIQNKIISNMITENGLEGILLEGGNLMLPAPEITLITESFISGIASPEALVQLFGDPEDEGETLFGETTCNAAGNFTWIGIMSGTNITATATDPNGNTSEFSGPFVTGAEAITSEPLPDRFSLYQNTPNPFNPSTTIRFQIPEPCFVSLKVFDLLGQEVVTLVDEYRAPGLYAAEWNASNLSSGIYICHMNAGAFTGIKKLVLQK
jgi:subtilase family serine protease